MGALTTFAFGTDEWAEADLISVSIPNGQIIRATNHNVDLVGPDGHVYSASAFGKWERGPTTFDLNTLTECDVTVTADTTVMFPGTTTPMLWVSKLFARSRVVITTATIALNAPTTIIGSVVVFVGRCTAPSKGSASATLKCSDETYVMGLNWPQRVICSGCPFTLFDRGCTLVKDNFGASCVVGSGSTQTNLALLNPNLLLWSEQFDNIAAWGAFGAIAATVAANQVVDPNGAFTADKLSFGTTGVGQESGINQTSATVPVNGAHYTFSVWLRADVANTCVIRTVQTTGQNDNSLSVNVTTAWQRFSISATMASVGTGALAVRIQNPASISARSFYVWGAQLENAAAATSYTQTTNAVHQLGTIGNDPLPFTKGYIVPTSGQAQGWPIMVTLQSDTSHVAIAPFVLPIAVGDTFIMYPGCNGTVSACEFKFNNLANSGSFTTVPGPVAAIDATGS